MGKQTKRVDFDPKTGKPVIINVSKSDPDNAGVIKDRGVLLRAAGKAIGKASRYLDPH